MNGSRPPSKEDLFSDLIRQCGDFAYNFAFRLTGNEQDAGDLVQTAFMKALENISRYDPSKPFQPWLNKILHNLYIDGVKRYERSHVVSIDVPIAGGEIPWSENLPSQDTGPLEQLSRTEIENTVQYALARLDVDYRAAVILSDMEEFSYEEISKIMGCPVGTVRSRIHRGRSLLRESLRSYVQFGR